MAYWDFFGIKKATVWWAETPWKEKEPSSTLLFLRWYRVNTH